MRSRSAPLLALVPLVLGGSASVPRAAGGSQPQAEVGRIIGSVEISSALTARRPRFRIYSDAGPAPPRNDVAGELRNVIIRLESPPDRLTRSPGTDVAAAGRLDSLRRGVMAQTDERFEPHVLPVLQGARVDFPNHDEVYHNVFSLSRVRTFDLGRYPKGSSKSVSFEKSGIVQVFCHIHSDMSAIVVVLGNPFFSAPDSSGNYAIENVPPGDYTIVGWHERTKPVSQRVRVVAGQTTTINFNLPLQPRPGM
jgi:plastocyanin